MLILPDDLVGRDVELGTTEVTPERIRRYALAIGDHGLAAGPCGSAPLGFALALRGVPTPEVELAPDMVSMHGGHVIAAEHPLTAPATYSIRARISDVFEKNGRSGPLCVIARRVQVRSADGAVAATVQDHQIVRRRPSVGSRVVETAPRSGVQPDSGDSLRPDWGEPEVGRLVGAELRQAPAAEFIAAYADSLGEQGPSFFTDRADARSLGYGDVIVPGPLLSALLEMMLRRHLQEWELRRLALTFRRSVVAGEPIALAAVVVERHLDSRGALLVCDLSLENGDGERAVLGAAELFRYESAEPGPFAG
jgi:acyl dehydratase